jgi:4'-phosphopantetheinyl transferase EntD
LKLSARLGRLFPDGTSCAELYGTGDPATLHPVEAAYCSGFAAKRVAEFAAGRLCARRALAELGYADFVLLAKSDRSPRWPAGVVGSITHTDGYCGAVVADGNRFQGLGLDAEIVGGVTAELWAELFTAGDVAQLAAAPAALRDRLATIMFSAKEAFYKCQFASTEEWVEFTDVCIRLDAIDALTGTFTILPARRVPSIETLLPVAGSFEVDGEIVKTGVAIEVTA